MTTRIRSLRETPTLFLLTSLTLLVSPVGALHAQSQMPDPAGEAGALYARIRHQEGPIAVVGNEGERSADLLGVNSPILPGDAILTGEGRVEVQLADGSLLRLDRYTRLEARVLSDLANQLENRTWLLHSAGSAYLYVERIDSSEQQFRLDTPTASIYFLTRGIFRVDVAEADGRTTVASHSGVAEVVSEGVSVLVRSGDRTDVRPYQRPSDTRPFSPFMQDEFDRWNRDRQAAYVKSYESLPASEVPDEIQPYVTELAYYGSWVDDPGYGWVWVPPAGGPDWSPYLVGRWHHAPAGWVWVSYEPWGWAPYHYGRWEYHGIHGWVWIPGRVFAGAWVSWAWGNGYVGWCPLGYYNRPVVHVHAHRTHSHRAWVFVPQDQVHVQQVQRVAVPKVRLESVRLASTPIDHAPVATPRQVAASPPGASPPPGTRAVAEPRDDGAVVSFRTLEGRGRFRTESTGATAVRRQAAPTPSRSVDFRPATSGRTVPPSAQPDRRAVPLRTPGDGGDEPAGRASDGAVRRAPAVPRATVPTAPPATARPRGSDDGETRATSANQGSRTGAGRQADPPAVATPADPRAGRKVRVIKTNERGDLLRQIFKKEPASQQPSARRPSSGPSGQQATPPARGGAPSKAQPAAPPARSPAKVTRPSRPAPSAKAPPRKAKPKSTAKKKEGNRR